MIEKFTTLKL